MGDSEPVTPQFVPGLELSRRLFEEAVRPLLAECFPGLRYSAARIGSGSEVLGHDTERSTDHDWGARLQVFLRDDDVEHVAEPVRAVLSERLPTLIAGWAPWVEVTGVADWFSRSLGFDPRAGVTTFDWLATPGQRLAEVTGGVVVHDGLGELAVVRERLRWYPDQLWWHLMACQWERIAEEEAFPGRCAEVGDELGCRIETSRLVRDVLRLALLVDRRYAPYTKWLGTAFSRSPSAARLGEPRGVEDLEGPVVVVPRRLVERNGETEGVVPRGEVAVRLAEGRLPRRPAVRRERLPQRRAEARGGR